jgi:hypothetical protein
MASVTLHLEEEQIPRILKILKSDHDAMVKEIHEMEIKLEAAKEKSGGLISQIELLEETLADAAAVGGTTFNLTDPPQPRVRLRLTILKNMIINLLTEHRSSGLGVSELVSKTDAQSSSVYRALGELESEKKVENVDRKWRILPH